MSKKRFVEGMLTHCEVVVRNGHFVYAAGDHGPDYVAKDRLYLYPQVMRQILAEMARIADRRIEVVIGPERAGIGLAPMLSIELALAKKIPTPASGWAEKTSQGFEIRRSFREAVRGAKVTIVEDVVNSSASVAAVARAVIEAGGEPIQVAAIWNRGGEVVIPGTGIPIIALIEVKLPRYAAGDCPLCQQGVAIRTDLGHGAEWLEQHPAATAAA